MSPGVADVQSPARQRGGSRLAERLRRLAHGTPLARFLGRRRVPDRVLLSPPEPWPGDARRGAAIIRGEFESGGDTAALDDGFWRRADLDERWFEDLHGFDWLLDLQAVGGDTARRRARELILDWIDANPPLHGPGWRPALLGRRLANWLARFEFYGASADDETRARLLDSLGLQADQLLHSAASGPPGPGRIFAAKGLVYAGLCLPDSEEDLARGLALLEAEIDAQILADGGHRSRSPSIQLALLRHLVDLRAALVATEYAVPESLPQAIARMAAMLRFYRHGDGRLALFNGSNEEPDPLIEATLTRSGSRGRAPTTAPDSGFQRLTAGRTLILADCGTPPPPGFDDVAHAGTLSFEMSVGRERLIVNCGHYPGGDGAWRQVGRATAAHSTAVVRNTNSSAVGSEGGLARRPEIVTVRREEADGAVLVDASHDGYVAGFGLVHRRRLYLSADGADLRGEDTLSGEGWHEFALRFHLHPGVRALPVQDESAMLLRLPGGDGWRFAVSGGRAEIQPSVYLGVRGRVQKSEQIVVAGSTEGGEAVVKWVLRRIPPRPRT